MPTNQLRRMLPPVFDAAGGAGSAFVDGLRKQLGGTRCPNDEAFAVKLATDPLYSTAEKNARLRLILERLELSFNHKEPAELSGAQIEHVLPQTLTPEWEHELGDGAEEHSSHLLHTLGNLTLTKYNAELSNRPYVVKQRDVANSHFVLNRHFATVVRWSPDAIRERGRALAQRAIKIWSDVGRESISIEHEKRAITPPVRIRFRDHQQPVTSWKDAFIKLLKQFDASSPGLLLRIATERTLTAVIAMNEDRFHRSKAQIGNVYINTHAAAAQLQDWCGKVAELGRIGSTDFAFVMPDGASDSLE
ncbi:MAG: HNH endonuclease family protein [Planctomycetota bacterium]|nr:HNH endonuclease family protein [Planctomycetota bacterium]